MHKISEILPQFALSLSLTSSHAYQWPYPLYLRLWKILASPHVISGLDQSSSRLLTLVFSKIQTAILSNSTVFLRSFGRKLVCLTLCFCLCFPIAICTPPWFFYVHPFVSHRCLSSQSCWFCPLFFASKQILHLVALDEALLLLLIDVLEVVANCVLVQRHFVTLFDICPN